MTAVVVRTFALNDNNDELSRPNTGCNVRHAMSDTEAPRRFLVHRQEQRRAQTDLAGGGLHLLLEFSVHNIRDKIISQTRDSDESASPKPVRGATRSSLMTRRGPNYSFPVP